MVKFVFIAVLRKIYPLTQRFLNIVKQNIDREKSPAYPIIVKNIQVCGFTEATKS